VLLEPSEAKRVRSDASGFQYERHARHRMAIPNDYGDYQGQGSVGWFFASTWTDSRQGNKVEDQYHAGSKP
jgi:hypothetical protein